MFRAFAKEFLQYAKTYTRPGTKTFYSGCLGRIPAFALIADAPMHKITGETVNRYARHRQELAENSVVTVNGDLRTLRCLIHNDVDLIFDCPACRGAVTMELKASSSRNSGKMGGRPKGRKNITKSQAESSEVKR